MNKKLTILCVLFLVGTAIAFAFSIPGVSIEYLNASNGNGGMVTVTNRDSVDHTVSIMVRFQGRAFETERFELAAHSKRNFKYLAEDGYTKISSAEIVNGK
jgi:hypothetical protein